MRMKKLALMPPKLHLSVQYATPVPELPRWRVRRWVQHAVNAATHDLAQPSEHSLRATELTIRFVDAAEALELNSTYRGRDYATNVLTFEYGTDPDGTASGDIVLCVPVLHNEAREQNKPLLHHAAHLIIHGVFHALGYDHTEPEEAEHMERLETTLLGILGIEDPYQTGRSEFIT